jgi:hypothetical protein
MFRLIITMTFLNFDNFNDEIIFWFNIIISFVLNQACLAWYIIFRYFTFWACFICSFKNITLSNFFHSNNSRLCSFVKLLYFCHNDFSIIEVNWKKSLINITIDMFSKNLFVSRFYDLTIMQLLSILINNLTFIILISLIIIMILLFHNRRTFSWVFFDIRLFILMLRNE